MNAVTPVTLELQRNMSYVKCSPISGNQAGFIGGNDETSAREVQFKAYHISKGGQKKTFVTTTLAPNESLPLTLSPDFPDAHDFYGDLDVPWAFEECYAVANLYVC